MSDAAPPEGISLRGTVSAFMGSGASPRLAGVEVCLDETTRCVLTNEDGEFVLEGIPPETQIALLYKKEGYGWNMQPLLSPRFSSSLDGEMRTASLLIPLTYLNFLTDALSFAFGSPIVGQSATGRPAIGFSAGSSAGATLTGEVKVSLDPPSGSGPFYLLLSNGMPVLNLRKDQLAVGAMFVDIEPRDEPYELVFEHEHGDCQFIPNSTGGWPPRTGRRNAIGVPVRLGYETGVVMAQCVADTDAGP